MVHYEISSYFLVAIFKPYPSAVIQRAGRVGLLSVPHGKLHLSNQNFQFYCATIAYHVGLNAESNRTVEGLQLRLEICQFFLDYEVID